MKVEKQEARVLLCTWTGKRTAGGRRRVELDRQPPLAGETAARGCQRYQAMIIKVSRRVSVTSAFGQGTAGKGNRADMAAPLTPAYGHCIAARPDSDRRPRQSLFQRPHDQGNSADRLHAESSPSK
ncbi:hypothetical protein T12_14413 [Trichinella patagoniensis]|uniref:Uncharacterized protein n=1 Tax=Trichinella patagoniensis TaxID=990121 RepID=A0A0V0ZWG8_9BILA|nr:hypothetical protein T12_14413 [Trichinella patagoniensis]